MKYKVIPLGVPGLNLLLIDAQCFAIAALDHAALTPIGIVGIVLTPDASKTRLIVDLEGDLAGILAMSADQASLKRPNFLDIDTFGEVSSLFYRLGDGVSHYDVGINGCGSSIWTLFSRFSPNTHFSVSGQEKCFFNPHNSLSLSHEQDASSHQNARQKTDDKTLLMHR
ncbi:hypothetical protein [Pacificibacter sp. AS14]|uniref:hypothetical protein n=1 Tax=Pacificibacter sp. AS14 TaxID=3135785 RepID=UPI0031803461